jgi:hypothetical protein
MFSYDSFKTRPSISSKRRGNGNISNNDKCDLQNPLTQHGGITRHERLFGINITRLNTEGMTTNDLREVRTHSPTERVDEVPGYNAWQGIPIVTLQDLQMDGKRL